MTTCLETLSIVHSDAPTARCNGSNTAPFSSVVKSSTVGSLAVSAIYGAQLNGTGTMDECRVLFHRGQQVPARQSRQCGGQTVASPVGHAGYDRLFNLGYYCPQGQQAPLEGLESAQVHFGEGIWVPAFAGKTGEPISAISPFRMTEVPGNGDCGLLLFPYDLIPMDNAAFATISSFRRRPESRNPRLRLPPSKQTKRHLIPRSDLQHRPTGLAAQE